MTNPASGSRARTSIRAIAQNPAIPGDFHELPRVFQKDGLGDRENVKQHRALSPGRDARKHDHRDRTVSQPYGGEIAAVLGDQDGPSFPGERVQLQIRSATAEDEYLDRALGRIKRITTQ